MAFTDSGSSPALPRARVDDNADPVGHALLAFVATQSDAGLFVVDRGGRLLFANAAAAALAGRTTASLAGMRFADAMAGLGPSTLEAIANAVATGLTIRDLHTQSGALRCSVYPAPGGGSGEPAAVIECRPGSPDDSTRDAAESALRALLDAEIVPLIVWNRDGRVLLANDAYLALVECTREDVAAGRLSCAALTTAATRDAHDAAVTRLHAGGGPVIVEKAYDVHGRTVPVLTSSVLLPGDPPRGASAVIDLSPTRRVERDLREASDRLAYLVTNTPMAVIEQAADGSITRWAGEAERIFGWAAHEVLGLRFADLPVIFDEDAAMISAVRERLWSGRESRIVSFNRNRTRSGRVVHCQWYNSVLAGENGRPRAVLSIALDATDRVLAETELREARRRAEAASAAKSEFLAHISHEIRTPLTAILGLADVALREPGLTEARQRIAALRTTAHALKQLLDDVLDFAKLDAGRLPVERAAFDPVAIVSEVARAFETTLADKGVALVVDVNTLPTRVVGDALRLRQVLFNLIGNAVKFTDQGRVTVSGRFSPDTEMLAFEVADTGIGLSPQMSDELFEAFTQEALATARRYGGTGLGLAICKRLVTAMGGTIAAANRPGGGASFRFSVRVTPEAEPAADLAAPPAGSGPTVDAPSPDGRGLHVLVAEDNDLIREVEAVMLRELGNVVSLARSGREAVERVAAGGIDVVLMDIRMPEMDGMQALAAIRALPAPVSRVPVIALSADRGALDPDTGAGFAACLVKPVEWDQLQQTLEAVVRGDPVPSAG